jgi:hypothetical protein
MPDQTLFGQCLFNGRSAQHRRCNRGGRQFSRGLIEYRSSSELGWHSVNYRYIQHRRCGECRRNLECPEHDTHRWRDESWRYTHGCADFRHQHEYDFDAGRLIECWRQREHHLLDDL